MASWTKPLGRELIAPIIRANKHNGPVTVIDGPIGPMIKLACTFGDCSGKVFYCGGEEPDLWVEEFKFLQENPNFFAQHHKMPDPEFDLDDMELAEIIMEELK